MTDQQPEGTPRPDDAAPRGSASPQDGRATPAPWERVPVEHTQEIPPQPPAGQSPVTEPVWAGGSPTAAPGAPWTPGHPGQPGQQAYPAQPGRPGTGFGHGATPTVPPASRRRSRMLPAALLAAAALAGGGAIAAGLASSEDTSPVAATAPSASATSQIGANTAPAVDPGSAVAPDWTRTAAAVTPSVVSIDIRSGSSGGEGSGVIVDTAGHVVTNNHVASGAGTDAQIVVTLSDQRAYAAKVVGTDPSTDLAVLKIDGAPSDLKAIAFGDSGKLVVGQPVMAVGNPLGLSGTVTTGIVSALNRPVTTTAVDRSQDPSQVQSGSGNEVFTNAIQTSAAINPGNSGGALVDAQGRLVGINSSIASLGSAGGQSGNIGIGFAIPVNEVTTIAKQLIATGKAEHAYLGVAAPTAIVRDGQSRREAAVIQRVYEGTPAAKAGLRQGDAIVSLDGTPITGYTSLISQVYGKQVGQRSTVEYIRDGKRGTLEVTFDQRPARP